jgi:hypothetical protein
VAWRSIVLSRHLGSVLDFLVTNMLYLFSIYSLLNFPKKIKLSPFKALFAVSLTA